MLFAFVLAGTLVFAIIYLGIGQVGAMRETGLLPPRVEKRGAGSRSRTRNSILTLKLGSGRQGLILRR